jgi:hypothetical protein
MMSAGKNRPFEIPGIIERVVKTLCFMSFKDPELERRFLIKKHNEYRGYNRIVSTLGFWAISGFYLMNYLLMEPVSTRLYILPYYVAVAALGVFFIMTLIDMPHYMFKPLATLAVLIINAAPLVSLMAFRYPETYFFHTGCVVLVFITIVFARINFYYIAGFSVIYLLVFELLFFSMGPHLNVETFNLHYILLFSMGIGLVVSYNLEKRERINFVKLRIIVEERMKLSMLKDASPDAPPKTKK